MCSSLSLPNVCCSAKQALKLGNRYLPHLRKVWKIAKYIYLIWANFIKVHTLKHPFLCDFKEYRVYISCLLLSKKSEKSRNSMVMEIITANDTQN